MRMGRLGRVATVVLFVTGLLLSPSPIQAGVPRVCIWPTYDPLECPVEMRKQLGKVTSPRRMRVREEIRHRIREGRIPSQPGPLPVLGPSSPRQEPTERRR
jgi:hypothetical protein